MKYTRIPAQGAIEYLLLVAGAILVAAVALVILLQLAPSEGEIVNQNLCAYGSVLQGQSCTPYLSGLSAALVSTAGGIAQFDFTWHGSQYPPSRGESAAGIVGGTDLLVPPLSGSDLSSVFAWSAGVENGAPIEFVPLFSPQNESGQNGLLSNNALKSMAHAQFASSGNTSLQFSFWLSDPAGTLSPYSEPASIPFPMDQESPTPVQTFSATTGASSGMIHLNLTESRDRYLGGPLDHSFFHYEIVYSNGAITEADFAPLLGAGSFAVQAAAVPDAPLTFDIQVPLPAASYHIAIRACDDVDARTVLVSNCSAASFATALSGA